jgi:hypothetical protein
MLIVWISPACVVQIKIEPMHGCVDRKELRFFFQQCAGPVFDVVMYAQHCSLRSRSLTESERGERERERERERENENENEREEAAGNQGRAGIVPPR